MQVSHRYSTNRKRANTLCSLQAHCPSRFRYNPKTCRYLSPVELAPYANPRLGLLLILAGLCFECLPAAVYSNLDFWKTSPNLFFIRTGCACLLLALTTRVTEQLRFPRQALHALSRESLVIYILHICILYGSPWNTGLRHRIGPSLGLTATLGCIAALVVSMVAVALTWHRLKRADLFSRLVGLPATALATRVLPSRGRQE